MAVLTPNSRHSCLLVFDSTCYIRCAQVCETDKRYLRPGCFCLALKHALIIEPHWPANNPTLDCVVFLCQWDFREVS